MGTNALEELSQIELARYVVDALRRTVLHYGIWFNEVVHQLGLEEAIRLEEKVASSLLPIAVNRLSKTLDFQTEDGLPLWLINMERENLISLINSMSANWLTNDGVWFRTIEDSHDIYISKRCNDTCWTRYSPVEANTLRSFLRLPEQSGLDGLEQALKYRLYANINEQAIERSEDELILRMVKCLVQKTRGSQGLPDYPCKSAGLAEFEAFARTIDSRIRTECISCPPDQHPREWVCAWRFHVPR